MVVTNTKIRIKINTTNNNSNNKYMVKGTSQLITSSSMAVIKTLHIIRPTTDPTTPPSTAGPVPNMARANTITHSMVNSSSSSMANSSSSNMVSNNNTDNNSSSNTVSSNRSRLLLNFQILMNLKTCLTIMIVISM